LLLAELGQIRSRCLP
ncbi:hypothetical protein D047_4073B, partial [Vibrio parahaemolyticus VPTS-2010_2]